MTAPIATGHPGFCLTPIVIELSELPEIHDKAEASQLPALAMLSAMAHRTLETAIAAVSAIRPIHGDRFEVYMDYILRSLSPENRHILEERMSHEFKSEFALRYLGKGREEGRAEGREEGRAEGREEGREEIRAALRVAAAALARSKLVSETETHAIDAISDLGVLKELVFALGQAGSVDEARAVLRRALGC